MSLSFFPPHVPTIFLSFPIFVFSSTCGLFTPLSSFSLSSVNTGNSRADRIEILLSVSFPVSQSDYFPELLYDVWLKVHLHVQLPK